MKHLLLIGVLAAVLLGSCAKKRSTQRVLVFSKTAGFRHTSIPAGKQALLKLGAENGMQIDTTEDASYFTEDSLKAYSAVVFLNTSKDVLDFAQQADFERYIQAGGGFVGIHAATDTEYEWPWYGELVGAYFKSHPQVQPARLRRLDASHPSTLELPQSWEFTDEWYNFQQINPHLIPLLEIDETSYQGGENPDFHPISWYHEFDGGRAWYTNLGHEAATYTDERFLAHLLGGLQYAIGENLELDYSRVRTHRKPDDSRFVMRVLDDYLNEPLELVVLPGLDVLFVQRRGQLMLYEAEKRRSRQVGQLQVHTNYEDGLYGIDLDPDFEKNNWIYLYYAPAGPPPIHRLSRFSYVNDSLYLDSEKVILEVPVQRRECCHTGGSVTFGADGLLYLSTGDDTNPFETAYAPINELPDRSPWDAQKSSANPNDLRGKILRIKVKPDGSYSIPDGNLFPKDGSRGRPEIYVMGCRNPYRISVDPKKGYVYWGDIGPDARVDSSRGPRGYDEINQAREPGFFGWPYFIADNQPYMEVDFATNEYLGLFDPLHPVNNSPNNTGIQKLPPAQGAFIYYPYTKSDKFPILGEGGRNAMAGPVYYYDLFKGAPSQFPPYYDGKLFIYDFMRDWVMTVRLDENDDFYGLEPFLPQLTLSSPMDMEFGPDGALYILEYGTRWFAANPDARLIRIDYSADNRAPVAHISADKAVGAAPLSVQFSAAGSYDHDGDTAFTYTWTFEEGGASIAGGKTRRHTYEQPGIYTATLKVTDPQGKSSFADMEIKVGNEPPRIDLTFEGNRSFYFDYARVKYAIEVTDLEDGSTADGSLDPSEVRVTFDYLDESADLTLVAQGHEATAHAALRAAGKTRIQQNGCIACHDIEQTILGPAYRQVALRYQNRPDAISYLAQKIISGGSGNWGGQAMTAFPQLSQAEAESMAAYILSLAEEEAAPASLPLKGRLYMREHIGKGQQGTYIFYVSYTDKGGQVIGPLSASELISLRSPRITADEMDEPTSTATVRGGFARLRNDGEYMRFDALDLSYTAALEVRCTAVQPFELEVRIDAPDGPLLGKRQIRPTGGERLQELRIPLAPVQGFHSLYLVGRC
ncbi:MAG: PKD domain-containing protein, partial [Bacteroidetes bacterium]